MDGLDLTDKEFGWLREFIRRAAGISLTPAKKAMVCSRLAKRLKQRSLGSYNDYIRFLASAEGRNEVQVAVDLITTHETYFFREPKHFDYLRRAILPDWPPGRNFRVWSAACSSGEEPYSIAMVLAEYLGHGPWEIVASDISTQMLERASGGQYDMERAGKIPRKYLLDYCLRGIGSQDGTFLVDPGLRKRVRFVQVALNRPLPQLGEFDLIFLRNVLIYFEGDTKREVISRLPPLLKRGGHLMVGHAESLSGLSGDLEIVQPSIYRKP